MLTNLQVRDFAIVDRIAVEFEPGMTVLTGETGAGKSILVDAVSLVLGERGGSQLVRSGAKRAEFSAEFDISSLPKVRSWLEEHALDQDDTCLLRRVISADGRSRAFINGNAATMQQLKSLAEGLLDIHGQHFHQSLVRRPVQRDLLDHFGELLPQRKEVEQAYEHWQGLQSRLDTLLGADNDRASRLDLLEFQLGELDALNLQEDELQELHSERLKLRNSGKLAQGVATALAQLSDNESGNASNLLAEASRAVESLLEFDDELKGVLEMLESAAIQIAEACDGLQKYGESVDTDPTRQDWVEDRIDALQSIARKHRIAVDELPALNEKLRSQYDELDHAAEHSKELEQQVSTAAAKYKRLAAALSKGRKQAAKAFSAAVSEAMGGLGMAGGSFAATVAPLGEDTAQASGLDSIEFLISANPGQPLMPLSRVASGGELSRMSLAIQVIASGGSAIPTMVFDEVDSGVGGRVAEMVGRRLQELGHTRQVLCVTHLPQVASLASHHFRISKVSDGKATRTGLTILGKEERIEELARMLGGVDITQTTLDHAAEMLAGAARKRA